MKKSLGAKALVYPTPVFIVCTYDEFNKPNAMNVAWGGLCCSSPPCVAVSLRKATYSYQNILKRKSFTINIPSETHIRQADHFGIVSGKTEDKFSTTGLTPVKGEFVDAPYIEEFPFILECKLFQTVEIGMHTQFIGEIIDAKADESVMGEDGNPQVEKIRPPLYVPGSRTYYGIGQYLGKAFSIGKEI